MLNVEGIKRFASSPRRNAILVATACILGAIVIYRRAIKTTIRNIMNNSYFTIDELCYSNTAKSRGIDNTPSASVKANLQSLITNLLDPIREKYGDAITVTSGYRCPTLNTVVGGVSNSQHLTGQAADLQGSNGNNLVQLRAIMRAAIAVGRYDQLIIEVVGSSRWIHVSYDPSRNRREILFYKNGTYTKCNTTSWEYYLK